MNKKDMQKLLGEYCDLKLQMQAMGEAIAEMNAIIKENAKLAESIAGFVVNVTDVDSEGVSLPQLREELPEKTFAKYIKPFVRQSSYTRLTVKRTAQENLVTIVPALQRRAR